MANDSDYIANFILGDYATNKQLEKAVESGARGAIKSIVKRFICWHFPDVSSWTFIVDTVVGFVLDYFGL